MLNRIQRWFADWLYAGLVILAILVVARFGLNMQRSFAATTVVSPTATNSPPPETIHLKIPIEKIVQPQSVRSNIGDSGMRMVIITKSNITATNGAVSVVHDSVQICSDAVAYLNAEDVQDDYKEGETKSLLIVLQTKDLVQYGKAMAAVEQIYFAPEPTCQKYRSPISASTPFATPTQTSVPKAPTITLTSTSAP